MTALLGRDFRTSDEGPHASKIVILSDRLWRQLFGGDAAAVGHVVKLDGDNYTVIGVMPRDFDNVLAPSAELWTPDQYDASQVTREFNSWAWGNHLRMVSRLRPGVSAPTRLLRNWPASRGHRGRNFPGRAGLLWTKG